MSKLIFRPFDLHVLGMPPAFILSQDQTLHLLIFFLTLARLVSLFALLIPYSELTFPVQFSKIDFLASRLLRSALVYITILSLFRQAVFSFFLLFFIFVYLRLPSTAADTSDRARRSPHA